MYKVVLKKSAEKNLQKVDHRYKKRILSAIIELGVNPFLGKSLKGELSSFYSFRVWPYRIIYIIYKHELTVLVIAIDHRQGAYN